MYPGGIEGFPYGAPIGSVGGGIGMDNPPDNPGSESVFVDGGICDGCGGGAARPGKGISSSADRQFQFIKLATQRTLFLLLDLTILGNPQTLTRRIPDMPPINLLPTLRPRTCPEPH